MSVPKSTKELEFSSVVQVMVTEEALGVPLDTAEIVGGVESAPSAVVKV